MTLVTGLLAGLGLGRVYGTLESVVGAISIGLGAGLAISIAYPVTWPTRLAFLQVWLSNDGPVRLMRLFEDARARHILRTVGPVYQFRHARLQDLLKDVYRKTINPVDPKSAKAFRDAHDSGDWKPRRRTDDRVLDSEAMPTSISELKTIRLRASLVLMGAALFAWPLAMRFTEDLLLFYVVDSAVVLYFFCRLVYAHTQLRRQRKRHSDSL
ncbi:MAG TPA: hypothetical protein VFM55_05015 [Micromonosporaceae bacterium]|nr:hypothetical protein [Micromonosporaceae bacterium]